MTRFKNWLFSFSFYSSNQDFLCVALCSHLILTGSRIESWLTPSEGRGGGEEGTEGGREGGREGEGRGEGRGKEGGRIAESHHCTIHVPHPNSIFALSRRFTSEKINNITDLPEESWAVCCNLITKRLTKTIHPWAFIRKTRREMFATEQLLDIFLAFGVLDQ